MSRKFLAIILSLMIGLPLSSFAAFKRLRIASTMQPPLGSQINWDDPLAVGLRTCWLMNEGGAGNIRDIVSQANGTISAPLWVSGKFGSAINVTGVSSTVAIPFNSAFDFSSGNTGFSLSCWYNSPTQPGDGALFSHFSGSFPGWMIWTVSGRLRLYVNGITQVDIAQPALNSWHHVVATWDKATYRLYVDGSLVGSNANATPPTSSTSGAIIGGYSTNGSTTAGFVTLAKIQNMFIWARTLSPREVQELNVHPFTMFKSQNQVFLDTIPSVISGTWRRTILWTNHKPPFGTPLNQSSALSKGLVGLWCMNEGGGTTLYNPLGTGNISLTNAPWTISPFGSAVASNGSTSTGSISTTTGGPLDVTGAHISFGGWVYPTVSNVFQLVLMRASGPTDGNRQYSVFLSQSGTSALYANIGGVIFTPALSIPWVVNQWNHIFVTYDGANVRFYVNGKLSNTTAQSGNILSFSGASIYILKDIPNNNFILNGRADMMTIYNRTLSATEIQQLASYGTFSMFQPETQFLIENSGLNPIITSNPISQFFKSLFYKGVFR